ncbi:RNA polymerase II-associated protein 1 [Psilocybe cubensis]|uniref:RNA polymerase II-associated protein 1 C-terminal domain-containing protein n=2 Tax=Psilocybe cubensis TaxID=181762 RepID=A0A8H7XR19_PSICU|nr:RNA polymerase II-associated protein 1 [Psilocybe cubensis]KAH9480658.1 RNA polymerase II-associated protein 1 [Psilocybe cubensis]
MAQKPSLVGSIVERKQPSSFPTPKPFSSSKTGFPTVQHRSKSAFSRNREELRKFGANRAKEVPSVLPSNKPLSPPPTPPTSEPSDWRDQISRDNEERVAQMTEEEREEERRQIIERFGANVGDILKRARLARTKTSQKDASEKVPEIEVREATPNSAQEPIPISHEDRPIERALSPPPSALATPSNSRPSSRTDRKLRFAELEPNDVHVYESAPSTPKKRKALALPPPDPNDKHGAVSLGQWKGKMVPDKAGQIELDPPPIPSEPEEPEEGSAEYIRRHFFPHAPKDDPNLAWMDLDPATRPNAGPSSSTLRFDLHGNPIPPSLSESLPTHLGLHHHAEGSHAGYTLDDIFLLSRSTVPAQRATMLSVLARIASKLENVKQGKVDDMNELVGKEDELRNRILAAGIEALSSRGNVGTRAIEVVWECIVGWNLDIMDLEGVELESPSDTTIETLPLEFFLPQVTTILSQGGVPPESASQLLSILHRLTQENSTIATSIVTTPKLLSTILQTFLLTPIPHQDSSSSTLPDPIALQFFNTLALSSRSNAEEIEKLADSLLRFVVFSSFDSPYPPALAMSLLIFTLRLYKVLASYGLYSHIAGTAVEQLAHIEQFVISEACNSTELTVAWANLVEAWTVCATDPHQTTPPHDILWTQVVGWNWNVGISELQERLEARETDWPMWTASWQAQAAWLEGSKINAIKGGEAERVELMESVKEGFESGKESKVIHGALNGLRKELQGYIEGNIDQLKAMANNASVLASAIRLWLSCIPPHLEGVPSSPPFSLPFVGLSELSRQLLEYPLWALMDSSNSSRGYLYCREMSRFMSYYLLLSRRLPQTSQSLWLAQSFSILQRLGPGDEDFAQLVISELSKILTQQWAESQKINVSPVIWEKGGLSILEPFMSNLLRPNLEAVIGPLTMTPQSIKSSTSQRLPAPSASKKLGMPLRRDWTTSPLDHLLRSGDSEVFKALPISWDSSEVEVARASLFLTKVVQESLLNFSMTSFVVSREEAELSCMKIFMLEHGQTQTDSTEEVFRDSVVEHLMEDILRPYAIGSSDASIVARTNHEDLEKVASRFLGTGVPFFQFYTDFVSLYDAISFSHPLFARLLLPPTSMRYPLDYRKHLWCDFNHVVKTIRVPELQVLSADIREYFYPIEKDPQVIASYLSSLLKDDVHDFVRLVALHHISSNIWPDLQEEPRRDSSEARASTLLKTVVGQSKLEIIRDVVRYRQQPAGSISLPPHCFEDLVAVKASRLDCIMKWGGQAMFDRLQGLLNE